jgi:phage terminase small subunit
MDDIKLTDRRERFAQGIASGMTQADAYRAAYNTDGWKPDSVWSKSAQLAADVKVKQRIDELKGMLVEKELWTREDSVRTLKEVIADPEARVGDRTQAVKVLNDMHGYNAPQKVEVSGDQNKPLRVIFEVIGGSQGKAD